MRRLSLLLALGLLGAATASPGSAQDRAAEIGAEVERALERLAGLDPSFAVAYGAIDVVPRGVAYDVSIADASVRLAANDPGHLDIGSVSFRLLPQPGNLFRVDRIMVPARIPRRSGGGRVDGVWELEVRRLSGLWSRRRGGFLRREADVDISLAITGLDAAMAAIAAAPPQAGSDLRRLQLLLFRGLARREAAPDGVFIDRYDLRMTPEGSAVVNGQPLDFLSPAVLSMP